MDSSVRAWREIAWKGANLALLQKEVQALLQMPDTSDLPSHWEVCRCEWVGGGGRVKRIVWGAEREREGWRVGWVGGRVRGKERGREREREGRREGRRERHSLRRERE